jgi:uncharacterized membrane protein YdbT with pleckstrin-like domain
MGFPKSHLNQSEEVVMDLHPHWWFLVPRGALLLAVLALGGYALTLEDSSSDKAVKVGAAIVVLGALLYFVMKVLTWLSTDFVVTSERCVYRSGIFTKKGVEIPLDRINTVFFHQGVFERIIRAGDIGIESAGENSRQEFSDIYNPVLVQTTIYRQMEQYENRRQDRLGDVVRGANTPAPAPAPAGLSVAEQLEKLEQLKHRGSLTEEEFQSQKAKLLG